MILPEPPYQSWKGTLYRQPTLRMYECLIAHVRYGSQAHKVLGISDATMKNNLYALRWFYNARNTTHLVALVFKHMGDIFDSEFQ